MPQYKKEEKTTNSSGSKVNLQSEWSTKIVWTIEISHTHIIKTLGKEIEDNVISGSLLQEL